VNKQVPEILKTLVGLPESREQANTHIELRDDRNDWPSKTPIATGIRGTLFSTPVRILERA
jgi:hypothetical protein